MKRVCSVCDVEKDIAEFTKDARRPHGIGGKCKVCKAAQDWRNKGGVMPEREDREPDLRILSLGAGVQSTTVLLMSALGELPKLDAAVFADTQWEPQEVYDHLDWLIPVAEDAGIPVHVVSKGSLREARLETEGRWIALPLFFRNPTGTIGMGRRQCTHEFKIVPIRTKVYELAGRNANRRVQQWVGISWDESERMKDSGVLWIENHFPLVDRRMTRADCLRWMNDHYSVTPPKSSCIGCPYHGDATWLRMRETQPVEWADAVDFDRRIREELETEGEPYLHRSLRPLDQVVFRDQPSLFGEECDGYCGV